MDAASTIWIAAAASGVVGFGFKLFSFWVEKGKEVGDKVVKPQPASYLSEDVKRIELMLEGIDRKVSSIVADNSASEPKTGRKMIYTPQGIIDNVVDLKNSSTEHIAMTKQFSSELLSVSKQINNGITSIGNTLRDFFRSNSATLEKNNSSLEKNNKILSDVHDKLTKAQ